MPRDGSCRAHRQRLVEFVEAGTPASGSEQALLHLDRCERCRGDLTELALALAALRRLHRDVAQVRPRADAWARLRARIERTRGAARATWPWRLRLGGTATSALIAAVVALPATTGGGATAGLLDTQLAERTERRALELRAEAALIAGVGVPGTTFASRRSRAAEGGSVIVSYPDGIRPSVKEVAQERKQRWPLSAS